MSKTLTAAGQKTNSARCLPFEHCDAVISKDQKEHKQIFPKPGWVEHDKAEVWGRTNDGVRGEVEKAGAKPGDIAPGGATNQTEPTFV